MADSGFEVLKATRTSWDCTVAPSSEVGSTDREVTGELRGVSRGVCLGGGVDESSRRLDAGKREGQQMARMIQI